MPRLGQYHLSGVIVRHFCLEIGGFPCKIIVIWEKFYPFVDLDIAGVTLQNKPIYWDVFTPLVG